MKLSLLFVGVLSVAALMGFAFFFGKQSGNQEKNELISVTGEPLPTETIAVPTPTSTPEATPSGKVISPAPSVTPTITQTPTPTIKLVVTGLKVNPNLIKNLQLVPTNTPTPTLIKVNLPIQKIPQL